MLRILIIAATTALVLLAGCRASDPDADKLNSLLDTAIVRLGQLPAPTTPLPPHKSDNFSIPDPMQVRRDLRRGDVTSLRAYLPEVNRRFLRGEVSEEDFDRAFSAVYASLPEALPGLDRWVHEEPREYTARMARGLVRARAGGDAWWVSDFGDPPHENLKQMRLWQRHAAHDFVVALDLSPRPVAAVAQLMLIAQGNTQIRKAHELLAGGERFLPGSSELYRTFIPMLYAEWSSGSPIAMTHFLELARQHGVDDEVISQLERHLEANRDGIVPFGREAALAFAVQFSEQHNTYDGWLFRSRVEREQGLLEAAEKSIDRAAERRPDSTRVIEERGYIFEERGLYPEALAEYERGAALESSWAREKLIYAYLNGGLGLKMDLVKARPLCEQSSAAHETAGEFCLGWLYHLGGGGLSRDDKLAAQWEYLAARKGHKVAASNLGYRYLVGRGVVANREEGLYWLKRSAQQGYQPAIGMLEAQGISSYMYEVNPTVLDRIRRQIGQFWAYLVTSTSGNQKAALIMPADAPLIHS